MANGINRKRTIYISKEVTFGVAPATPAYLLPVTDFKKNEEVMHSKNEAWTGSRYRTNDKAVVRSQSKPSFTCKVDEAFLPLLLLPFGTLTTTSQGGDTLVKIHTIVFNNNNQNVSYTIYIDDPDRGDEVITGWRPEAFNMKFNKNGHITIDMSGLGKFPVASTVTGTLVDWQEFTSAHAGFRIADSGGSLTALPLLEAGLNHGFGLTGDDDNHLLGTTGLDQSFNTESDFTSEVKLHYPDITYRTKWQAGTSQQFEASLVDTGRIITGSTTNVNPSVVFSYPSAYLSEWSEDGSAGDILKQNQTIQFTNKTGVTDAPVKIIVKNAVASY